MKYLNPPALLTVFAVGLLSSAFAPSAEARVGESAQVIERRVYSNGGIKYRDDEILAKRSAGMPYAKYMDYMPGSVKVSIYFKTDDGRKPKSSDMESARMKAGWDLHVVYINGESALEVYKRSKGMSEFEFNQLLVLQGGNGWQRVEKKKPAEGELPPPSAFGHTMETKDGGLRAKKLGGDSVMFFKPELDENLAVEQLRDLQDLAPRSVMGF